MTWLLDCVVNIRCRERVALHGFLFLETWSRWFDSVSLKHTFMHLYTSSQMSGKGQSCHPACPSGDAIQESHSSLLLLLEWYSCLARAVRRSSPAASRSLAASEDLHLFTTTHKGLLLSCFIVNLFLYRWLILNNAVKQMQHTCDDRQPCGGKRGKEKVYAWIMYMRKIGLVWKKSMVK